MQSTDRTYRMYLEDILLAMKRIAEYIEGHDFKEKYRHVPWHEMYYLRNKVSHEYFGIDYEIIWDIACNYLPSNKEQLEHILLFCALQHPLLKFHIHKLSLPVG
jgi:uncharacterized protein with HEPN domain